MYRWLYNSTVRVLPSLLVDGVREGSHKVQGLVCCTIAEELSSVGSTWDSSEKRFCCALLAFLPRDNCALSRASCSGGSMLTPWGCNSCVASWVSTLLCFKLMCAELAVLLACSSLSKHEDIFLFVCRKYSVYCSVWQECAGSHDGHVTFPFCAQ